MSSSAYYEARSLLRERLLALPNLNTLFPGGIEWQGEPYQSVDGNAYVRETLKPGQSRRAGPGPMSFIRNSALYLLDIFSPSFNGVEGTDSLGDIILSHFWPGLALPGSSTVVKIISSSAGDGPPDSSWRMNSITINFYFDTINPQ